MSGGVGFIEATWSDVREAATIGALQDARWDAGALTFPCGYCIKHMMQSLPCPSPLPGVHRWIFTSQEDAACFYERMLAYARQGRGKEVLARGSVHSPLTAKLKPIGELCTRASRRSTMVYLFTVGRVVARIQVRRGKRSSQHLRPESVTEIAAICAQLLRDWTFNGTRSTFRHDADVVFAEACDYDRQAWERLAGRSGLSLNGTQEALQRLARRTQVKLQALIEGLLRSDLPRGMPHTFGTVLDDDIMDQWLLRELQALDVARYRDLELWQVRGHDALGAYVVARCPPLRQVSLCTSFTTCE